MNSSTNFLIFLAIFVSGCAGEKNDIALPNIVFLLVDDLGWSDLTCYGSTFHETPNIDKLASEGMRFTNAYAACPVCSPTRASILTGRYPARLNITDWIPGSDPKDKLLLGTKDRHELPLEEITLAELLKGAGYKTGFFGKWHLGEPGFFPENQGFDLNIGGHWAGQPASYFYPYKNERKRWDVPGLEDGKEGEYLTDRLTDESLAFMEANRNNPFLLYLAYYNVHTPIQSKPELGEKYEVKKSMIKWPGNDFAPEQFNATTKLKQDNPAYAGMVHSVDESVGRIMAKIEEMGFSENTVIIFTSDNGGLSTLAAGRKSPTSVLPLRAGKGWLYEGGIRVPAILKWPGVVQEKLVCETPITSTDFYPTIAAICNLKLSAERPVDGQSILPLLQNNGDWEDRDLYWHFPHYHGSNNRPSAAVRSGDYKLIKWFEDNSLELYNLKDDLGEKNNIAGKLPEKTKELLSNLEQWQNDVGALFPEQNPDYKD